MEQSALKEILHALALHSKHIDEKMDQMKKELEDRLDKRFDQVDKRFEEVDRRFEQVDRRFEQIDKRFEQMDERFDRLEKKFDGARIELIETQENVDYLLSKSSQHERKLRNI